MAIGDLTHVPIGDGDITCLDIGLYGIPNLGAVYFIDSRYPTVIETGTGRNVHRIREALTTLDIAPSRVENILVTHIHLDHAGGAGQLAVDLPNATVYVHERGAPFLTHVHPLIEGVTQVIGDLWEYHEEPVPIPSDRIVPVADGDTIDLGERTLEAIGTPGHALHHLAFHDQANDALFVGDAAGIWIPDQSVLTITTPPTTFDLDQNLADLDRMRSLNPTTLLYSHFGVSPAGTLLADYRDRLTGWVSEIRTLRDELEDAELVDHLSQATTLKEAYGEPIGGALSQIFVMGVIQNIDRGDAPN